MSPLDPTPAVKALALQHGFDLVGIARPEPSAHANAYRAWIAAGSHGQMEYLARNVEERLDIRTKFPWAKSILCVGLAYWQPSPAAEPTAELAAEPVGKIARYAWGRDYHKVFEGKLQRLEKALREIIVEPFEARSYADTGPILEREFAARAGLGWIGKHTLLIHPHKGSWFLLGELILSVEFTPDEPLTNHCGTCTRCIDACPTQAITPYQLNATRCISYLTLEHRGPIDPTLQPAMQEAGYLIGCDICQEVCPFNRETDMRPQKTSEPDFSPRQYAPAVSLQQVLAWQEQEWDATTRGSAARRAKFEMWKRNAELLQRPAAG